MSKKKNRNGQNRSAQNRPANAHAPSDHQKKLAKNEFEWRGAIFTVSENALDDLDVVEALDQRQMTVVARQLLGERQYQTLKTHIADMKGGSASLFNEFMTELLTDLTAGK